MNEDKCKGNEHEFVSETIVINKFVESLWIYCKKCGEIKRLH